MDAKPNGCTDTGNYKLPTVTVVAQPGTEGREVWPVAEGRMPLVSVYVCVCRCACMLLL